MTTISRRQLLAALAGLPALVELACSDDGGLLSDGLGPPEQAPALDAVATATPRPPFIVAAGEQHRSLMAGTAYDTAMYVYGSGSEGPTVMVLGGVHGNEPGGWLAADEIVEKIRPARGALLVVPRANRVATELFERTTEAMGDLNRSYPGDPAGKPMQVMAAEIIDALKEFHVSLVIDMHESWAFYYNRPQSGTAYLGQTVATYPAEPGITLARNIVEGVNQRIQAPWEELYFRDRTFAGANGATSATPINPAQGQGSSSSLGLPRWVPDLSAVLVEMGQQQSLDRRVALHVEVVREAMRLVGI